MILSLNRRDKRILEGQNNLTKESHFSRNMKPTNLNSNNNNSRNKWFKKNL